MEILIRGKKANLFIDYRDKSILFSVYDESGSHYTFKSSINDWEVIKKSVDLHIQNDKAMPLKPPNPQKANTET